MRCHAKRALLALPLVLAVPATASAQNGFLFAPPLGTVTVRGGLVQPTVRGEMFDSFRDWFTMSSSDFATGVYGADLRLSSGPLDFAVSLEYSRSEVKTSDREYVYQDDSRIPQTTTLRRTPLTFGARYNPLSRGEAISEHAFIPSRITPYIGGGVGFMFYKLQQAGDFVDRETLAIFEDSFESSGIAFAASAAGGFDYWVTPRVGITTEGRYTWASATPEQPFEFESVDLGGWQLTTGLSYRF